MNGAEYVVKTLVNMGVADVFGIPGGVVLDFLYAADKNPALNAHLNYHEQAAAFAALGYAQASGKLGVAYATRGPGIANMTTAIAEAFFESIPAMFLTAHSSCAKLSQRAAVDQEVDFTDAVSSFSKYSSRIDTLEDLVEQFPKICDIAVSGRKGPVFVDIYSKLWGAQLPENDFAAPKDENAVISTANVAVLSEKLRKAKRPLILIGDGVRQAGIASDILRCAELNHIPVISSRGSQDLLAASNRYYGYVGSHGIRYSNFILSKCDLIMAMGNRLSFPVDSKSYKKIYEQAEIIRIDVDEKELERQIPNSTCIKADLKEIRGVLKEITWEDTTGWLNTCDRLRTELIDEDLTNNVRKIVTFMKDCVGECSFVTDIGNNEFLVSRAYERVRPHAPLYCSKSFGTLGLALAKSIGVHYATQKPVVCFVGDQGFQYNIQELQYISQWKLPIAIVVMNNSVSGMIKDREIQKYGSVLHTTLDSGYGVPSLKKIAEAYGLKYYAYENGIVCETSPCIVEITLDPDEKMVPYLPIGELCQNLFPPLSRQKYATLNGL